MAANKIKHVTIEKLWGVKNISTDFNEDVNIFIGDNGTYKTTFLKLIEATLLCDIKTLDSIYFERIQIDFFALESTPVIVTKAVGIEFPIIKYEIGSFQQRVASSEITRVRRQYYQPERIAETTLKIKKELSQIINISWLSVNRDILFPEEYDGEYFVNRYNFLVDGKLLKLIKDLRLYRLQLDSEANKQASIFKGEVLSLMLYDEYYDKLDKATIREFQSRDMGSLQNDLNKAFNNLGVYNDKQEKIRRHIQKIKDVFDKMSAGHLSDLNELLVLSLTKRTLSIIEISKDNEEKTGKIYEPYDNFLKRVHSFMKNKEFSTNDESRNVEIALDENRKSIEITALSSGEKQLFILLTEALLQKEAPYLFIADEPELSLHIAWQKRILTELLNTNPNAQIIIATHSPEIAGNFPEKIVNMKNIITNEQRE